MRQLEDPRLGGVDRTGRNPPPPTRERRRVRRRGLVLGAVLVIAALATGAVVLLVGRGADEAPSAPPYQDDGGAPCKEDPLAHVHDPSRLEVVARCATASGTVERADRREGDGNWVLTVAPDEAVRRYLRPANDGRLPVEIIPTDPVGVPEVGARATFTGSWVLDKNKDRRAAIHPAWAISVGGRPLVPEADADLGVEAVVPREVPVGGDLEVAVRATSTQGARTTPASQVHLFLELVDGAGRGVRWKAASTTTLGTAEVRLVSLHEPGPYVLTVYAEKAGARQTTTAPLTVRRR